MVNLTETKHWIRQFIRNYIWGWWHKSFQAIICCYFILHFTASRTFRL